MYNVYKLARARAPALGERAGALDGTCFVPCDMCVFVRVEFHCVLHARESRLHALTRALSLSHSSHEARLKAETVICTVLLSW